MTGMTSKTQLQAARLAQGWSQPRLMAAMRRATQGSSLALPADDSLKTQLTRWENGRVVPGPEYQALFRRIYGLTASELGFPETQQPAPATTSAVLSLDALAYYRALLGEHVRADNRLGPRLVYDVTRYQAKQLTEAARQVRGPLRLAVLDTAFQYQEFLGWLLQDLGRYDDAMAHTDRARDLSAELENPQWSAYLLMRKSNIATDANDAALGVVLADAALRVSPSLPPQIQATILRQSANAHAALGNTQQCTAAIGRAFAVVAKDDDGDHMASYCTSAYVAMETASALTQLGKPSYALEVFGRSEVAMPEELRRDHGLALARLSTAHAANGNVDQACEVGTRALTVATATRSARTLRELGRLRSHLAVWPTRRDVLGLSASIASLVGSAA